MGAFGIILLVLGVSFITIMLSCTLVFLLLIIVKYRSIGKIKK